MSVLASNVTANRIGPADVGTEVTGNNTTKIASYAFLVNSLNALNYVFFNIGGYVITGVKTFSNGLTITGGVNPLTPITLGSVRASVLDLLPSTTGNEILIINNQTQQLSSFSGTGTYKNPILVKDTNNRIQSGVITTTSAVGVPQPFSNPFSSTPLVFLTTNVIGTDVNTGVFDVTPTGFTAVSNSTGRVFWVAIGS
jgi:hypothetical protein